MAREFSQERLAAAQGFEPQIVGGEQSPGQEWIDADGILPESILLAGPADKT